LSPNFKTWFSKTPFAALGLVAALVTGCQDAGPQRAAIEGRVTVAGRPLPAGRILFKPIAPTEGPVTSAVVASGAYSLPEERGPVVGQHRVEVEAELPLGFALDDEQAFAKRGGKPLPPNPIPPEFNRRSKLQVDVVADRENTFDIQVPRARGESMANRN
jgi:hypothetical protein